jgi:lipopolysaccharide transport system permease protein
MNLRVTIYTPESPIKHPKKFLGEIFRDVQVARELAWRLFLRDLSAQYRQTYLGFIWAFLPPLVASGTFIFLQTQGIVQITGIGIPYAAFAMIGTLLWQTFVEAIQSPLGAVQGAKSMLAKINFPREAILMASLYMVVFNLAIRLLLLTVVLAIWHIKPDSGLFLFPAAMFALLSCGFAMGLILLPLGTLYGDVGRGIGIVAGFWMLLTPVVYPARTTGLAGWLATWNPVAPVITTAREALAGGTFSHLPAFYGVTLAALLLCCLGLLAFRLVMPILIERMGG